jgi:AAA+ superfamily predicted ATPase
MPYRPQWVDLFARMYFTKTISQFILHGNIVDYVRSEDAGANGQPGKVHYHKLKDYLTQELFKRRDIVITYDRAAGIQLRTPEMTRDFLLSVSAYDTINKTTFSQGLPKDPARAFALLENYIRVRLIDGKSIALVLDYAETLIPMGQSSYASAEDRAILVYLLKWAKESLFIQSDMTTVLVTDNVSDLHQQLVRNPYSFEIEIAYPDEAERLLYIQHAIGQNAKITGLLEMSPEVLAKNTAGLTVVQLQTLMADVAENNRTYTFAELNTRKRAIIESEAGGLLGFVDTKYTLDNVAGHKYAKAALRSAATALKAGRQDVLPMGYLVNGPVGTGKTFMVSCFAADIGVPMVELKNFRSQWQGVTEANLEKVLKILKAMNPVAVMIDEADAYLGNRNSSGDSGVSSRVFSMIASFMSNTEHRGKIIWFLLTARPDLMPIDLKRQGRAEEHIALFYPETVAERKELLEVMLRKTKITSLKPDDFDAEFYETLKVNSGADMEAALTRAKFRAASKAATSEAAEVTVEIVKETFADFIPPTYPEEVELMNLVAVLECTSRELLPEKYKAMSRAEVVDRIAQLKSRTALMGQQVAGG